MTNPTIPFCGFYAAKLNNANIDHKAQHLTSQEAATFCVEKDGVILAAWTQFHGQGLWHSQDGHCVSYD